jgi:hypothetical protein
MVNRHAVARLLAVVVTSGVAACDPTLGDPKSGNLELLNRNQVIWQRADLPLRTTLLFDYTKDGFSARMAGTQEVGDKLRVQAGSLAVKPYPRWDLLLNKVPAEYTAREIAKTTIAVIDAPGSAAQAYKNLNLIDDLYFYPYNYYQYSSYSPASRTFDVENDGKVISYSNSMRVYDRGECSISTPWRTLYTNISDSLLAGLACGIKCEGEKPLINGVSFPGVFSFVPNKSYFINYAERSIFGFFPLFRRYETGQDFGSASDGFSLYGRAYISLLSSALPDQQAVFHASYKFNVEGGDIKVVPIDGLAADGIGAEHWAWVKGSSALVNSFESSILNKIPDSITAGINGNKSRQQNLPVLSFETQKCAAQGDKIPCTIKVDSCKPDKPKTCASNVRTALELGAQTYLFSPGTENLQEKVAKYSAGVRDEDFSCLSDAKSDTGFSCSYKIPFERVNIYPDSFEIMFWTPQEEGAHSVIGAFAAIEEAQNEQALKEWQEGPMTAPKPTPSQQAIPYCQGRFSAAYDAPLRNFDYYTAPSRQITADQCPETCTTTYLPW